MIDATNLLTPQIPHTENLLASLIQNNISWDASTGGLGKTYCAAALAKALGKKFIVICPKLVIPDWERVLAMFGIKAHFIINYEKLCRGNTKWLKYRKQKSDEARYFTTSLRFPKDAFIILDESHKCKGMESLNAGLMFALKRRGFQVHMLSATAAMSVLDMRAFGNIMGLHPDNGNDLKKFKQYAIGYGASWCGRGALAFDKDSDDGKKAMIDIHDIIFNQKKIASKMERKDFGGIFPDHQIIVSAYDMGVNSDRIQGAYDEMERELDELEEKAENYSLHVLAAITKARRHAELLKVPAMIEMTENAYDEGKSVVLFVNYTDTIEALRERLTHLYGEKLIGFIYGGQSQVQKRADMDAFQRDDKRIIVANLAAGGQSINLHDLNGDFPRESIINPSFSAINVMQSCWRTDRAYAKTPTIARFAYAARTIEETVCRKFQEHKDNLDLLTNGDLVPNDRIFKFAGGKDL